MSEKTTIEVSLETWQRLNARKDRPGESFDDVIAELLEHDRDGGDRDTSDVGGQEHADLASDHDRDVELVDELEPELAAALEEWEPQGEIRRERAERAAHRAVSWLVAQDGPRKRRQFTRALAAESELSERVWWERAVQPALRFLADRDLVEYRPGYHDYSA